MRTGKSLLLACLILWLALSQPALATPPSPGGPIYVVQRGDTLRQIALRYGVSPAHLAAANDLEDPDRILVGQRLIIPCGEEPAESRYGVHIVCPGETLASIAMHYRTSLANLITVNGLADPDYVLVGQRLMIPPSPPTSRQTGVIQGDGTPPLTAIHLTPNPALQGQTVVVHVRTEHLPLRTEVYGTLMDQEFELITDRMRHDERWALVGIPALMKPGRYKVQVTAEGYNQEIGTWLTILPDNFKTDYIQLTPETSQLLNPALIRAEWAELNRYWSHVGHDRLWPGPFVQPVPSDMPISSPFGSRRSYNGGPAHSYHEGIDFAAPEGTPVYAPATGHVVLAKQLTVRGNAVLIDHGWGVISGYFHLSYIEVEPGRWIEAGDLIGQVGSTGLSTGNHLHWEIRVRSIPVNPQQWMEQLIPTDPEQ